MQKCSAAEQTRALSFRCFLFSTSRCYIFDDQLNFWFSVAKALSFYTKIYQPKSVTSWWTFIKCTQFLTCLIFCLRFLNHIITLCPWRDWPQMVLSKYGTLWPVVLIKYSTPWPGYQLSTLIHFMVHIGQVITWWHEMMSSVLGQFDHMTR